MKRILLLIAILLASLLPGPVSASAPTRPLAADRVVKTACTYALGYATIDDLKTDLLAQAKRLAVNELFGEFITASTAVENFVVTNDQIRTSSMGFVRVEGDPEYRNGNDLAQVCVTIVAYVTDEDREQFEAVAINKRHCVTDPKLTTSEIKEFARSEVLVQALIDYNSKFKDTDRDSMIRLVQRVKYLDSGFVAETETYCVTAEGMLVPVEVLAFLTPLNDDTKIASPNQTGREGGGVTTQITGTSANTTAADGDSGEASDLDLSAGALSGITISSEESTVSGIRVEIRYADGTPKRDSYIGVYNQGKDVSGNPVRGKRITEVRTTDAGSRLIELDPGTYSLVLGDITGYPWTEQFNYTVSALKTTVLSLTLSRLQIGVRDVDTKGVSGRWTGIYLQSMDISNNPIKDRRIAEKRTNNAGLVTYDLMPGIYAVEVGDLSGYLWGSELDHALYSGKATTILVTLGRLNVGVKDAYGKPVAGRWVGVYREKLDIEKKPVKDKRILEGRTNNAGIVSWDLTEGEYALEIGDVRGNLWGKELGHTITAGQDTSVVLSLGQLVVALQDRNKNALTNRWVGIYYQDTDVAGNPIKGKRFIEGRTGNTGVLAWDLTAGTYVLDIENLGTLFNVEIAPRTVTTTDGSKIVLAEQ